MAGTSEDIAGAYYVNYPGYRNKIVNGFGNGVVGKAINGFINNTGLKSATVPLGHAGVMTVDNNGNTRYYEYGRYHNTGYGAQTGNGNYRRVSVPNAKIVNGEIDQQALANAVAKKMGRPVELTYVSDTDPEQVIQAIESEAKDGGRDGYSLLGHNCGSEACRAIEAGQSTGTKVARNIIPTMLNTGLMVASPLLYAVKKVAELFPKGKQVDLKTRGYSTTASEKNGGILNYFNYIS